MIDRHAGPDAPIAATRDWRQHAVAVLLLAMHAALAWALRVPGLTTGNDDAFYLALARALRGLSYAELPIAGTPAHAMYPPLYPAFLALLGATGPERIALAVAANIALSVTALALAAALAARWSPRLVLPLLVVCAPNPMLLRLASSVCSEPLFAALSLAGLLLLARSADERRHDARTLAIAGAAVIAAALTRSIGVAFIGATLALWALERRWRAVAAMGAAGALTVGAWLVWTAAAPMQDPGRSYIADATVVYPPSAPSPVAGSGGSGENGAAPPLATDGQSSVLHPAPPASLPRIIAGRVAYDVPMYLLHALPTALALPSVPGTGIDNAIWLVVTLVAGAVGALAIARRSRAVALFLGAYLLVLIVWPYVIARFLGPVIPLLALVLLVGTSAIARRLAGIGKERIALWALAIAIAAGAARADAARLEMVGRCDRRAPERSPGCYDAEQRAYFAAVEAARRMSPDSAVFLVSKEATFYMLAGRRAVHQSEAVRVPGPRAFLDFLHRRSVDYVLLARLHTDQWELVRSLRPLCTRFDLVGTFGEHVALLRVKPDGSPSSTRDGGACRAIERWAVGDWEQTAPRLW